MKIKRLRLKTLGILGSLMITTNIYASELGTVNTSSLNVRSGPSTNFSVIDKVHLGETLEIIEAQNNWYKITLESDEAYVHSNYVDLQENKSINPSTTDSALIDNLESKQVIDIIFKNNNLAYMKPTNIIGYIFTEVKKSKEIIEASRPIVQQDTIEKAAVQQAVLNNIIKPTNLIAKVNVSTLNVRQQPTTDSNKVGKVYASSGLKVLQELDDWVYIQSNDVKGYVYKSYVTLMDKEKFEQEVSLRQDIINYAKQFLGNPYVYGGNSLTNGADCSGFTQQVLKRFGINISRTSYTQINDGTRISKGDLLPGDLVFFGYNGRISHVAMYTGKGEMIHANNPSTGIIMSDLNSYGLPYIGATRVIK